MTFSTQKHWRIIAITLLCAGLALLSRAEDAIPVPTIIEQFPSTIHVDLKQNMLAFATGNKVYVYDLETGQQLWWKPSNHRAEHYNAAIGKDYVALFKEDAYTVLDKVTGNELWREEMSDWQHIEYAWFEPNSNLLRMRCVGSQVLYNLDTRQGYRVPFETYTRYSGLMPDGITLYTYKSKIEDSPPSSFDALFWQPGARQPTKRFTLDSSGALLIRGIAGNVFLVSDFLYKRNPEHILRTYDANTGEMVREFPSALADTMSPYSCWAAQTGDCFFWLDEAEKHLYKLDAASSESTVVTIPDGFRFFSSGATTTLPDNVGNWWYIATDEAQNICLLPFNHDGAPRKLVDGSRFLPASYCTLSYPYLLGRHFLGDDYLVDIYRLQDMQKLFQWQGYLYNTTGLLSTNLNYGMTTFPDRNDLIRVDRTYVYSSTQETPLFTVKGMPSIISPDGHYVVVVEYDGYFSYSPGKSYKDYEAYRKDHPEKNAVHVIEVQTQKVVARYDVKYAHARTAFSEDSRYLALHTHDELKVLDTLQEFREIPLFVPGRKGISVGNMEFSKDGQRLLASGYGEAFLFDVANGKHLLTLTEKARFKSQYAVSSRSNILRKMESKAKEFIGRYTDRFKNKPYLYAQFSNDEDRIITVAQNMLIRFWDAKTGTIVRTLDPQLPEERDQYGRINNSILLSKDGAYALTYNQSGFDSGTLWDLENSIKVRCYSFQGASQVEAAISETGDRVYALINYDLYFLSGAPEKKQ